MQGPTGPTMLRLGFWNCPCKVELARKSEQNDVLCRSQASDYAEDYREVRLQMLGELHLVWLHWWLPKYCIEANDSYAMGLARR